MSTHTSEDSMERFSRGKLEGSELADFKAHLLQCEECLRAVRGTDLFLDAMRCPAWQIRQHGGHVPGFKGEYCVVQAVSPHTTIRNIGILLANSGRLYSRFRRDFEEFAGGQADWLKQLTSDIAAKANELGTQKCLEWLKSASSGMVRISPRKLVVLADSPRRTLDEVYAEHIQAHVLPYRTHLPQYSLGAAADKFVRQMAVEPEGWAEVHTDIPLTDDMFLAYIGSQSMEPLIPAASLCAFRFNVVGSWDGKVLLVQQYGGSEWCRYTVKLCQILDLPDPGQEGPKAGLHQRVSLESINRGYAYWDVPSNAKTRALGEFLFVV